MNVGVVTDFAIGSGNGERKTYICETKLHKYESNFRIDACCGLYGCKRTTRQMVVEKIFYGDELQR